MLVEDALIGRAKLWHDARVFPFVSYSHFKEKFLEEFYSIEARMVAKSKWENRRFESIDNSLQEYYIEQVRDAKFCSTSLQEYEVNYLIVKQLPQRAREVLVTIDYMDTSKIIHTLARLDVTRCDGEAGVPSKVNNNNFSGNNNPNSKTQFGQARQAYDRNNFQNYDKRSQGQTVKNGYDDTDRNRNWRQRSANNSQFYREQNREKTTEDNRTNETDRADEKVGSNVRVINKSNMSEFVEELCWDVEPSEKTKIDNLKTKIVSPRIRAIIGENEVPILVDSGSEVTVISEAFYNNLKINSQLVELPVNNVTVNVAVGNKSTTIRRQVQLSLEIDNEKMIFPFLVVPGLSTNALVGIDWMLRFKCVIDVANQRIKLGEKELPDDSVTFRMAREVKAACRLIQTQGRLWYDSIGSQGRLGNELKKQEESIDDFENVVDEEQMIRETSEEINDLRHISENKISFSDEVREYVSKINGINDDERE